MTEPDFTKGLVPAVAQDAATGAVLMVAFMNDEAWKQTLDTGLAHFWSRSRKELWQKGATSGNTLRIESWQLDCDQDTVLLQDGETVDVLINFDAYRGQYLIHCHQLEHEDNGMMQMLECTDDASRTNYSGRERVVDETTPVEDVDAIYPRPSLELSYRQNMCFEDLTATGESFPGFEVDPPALED